jgi:hypothetical protein
VVTPSSAGYDAARRLWDTRFDGLRPRAIVYCATIPDVERVVRWGRKHAIHVVPRSGGHSYAGYSSGNGVVVADVSQLSAITLSGGLATVGAGATLGPVYAALAQHGVTIPAELRRRDVTLPTEPNETVEEGLLHLYKTYPDLEILFELMTDFDEGFQEWRYRHIKLVERSIGSKKGTGGSLGVEFLKKSLFRPVFPDLWAIRHKL